MSRITVLALLSVLVLAAAPSAEARKNPGNPLPAPELLNAEILAAGDSECDGDELTTDDVCVRVTFVKVCSADKYSVDLSKGFDTDNDGCVDTSISEDEGVPAEECTGVLNCNGNTQECQTADVSIGTTTFCVDDGDLVVDCVNDPEDVLVDSISLDVKVKGLNPPKKGPKSISQSTEFSNTLSPDINDECI